MTAVLELEGVALAGLDLAVGLGDPGPGLGGGAELLADAGAEGVALTLLMRVDVGGDGRGWRRAAWAGLLAGEAGAGACLVPCRQ